MFLCQTEFTAKLNTVLETIEIHREEMAGKAQTLMKAYLFKLGVYFWFGKPVWNSIMSTL